MQLEPGQKQSQETNEYMYITGQNTVLVMQFRDTET